MNNLETMSTIEYFELCYLEKIDDLFKELKEITKAYPINCSLQNDSSQLFNFIFQFIHFHDEMYFDETKSADEFETDHQ
ncbi:MAG: hypothetical protein CMD29_03235 [Flavobacteriales bacterium]|nr:hypothetical protein [Flavobacteriales bacterium]|tara:strand:- start:1681 stop:1917 length:237 start_codon:yes stop_codon:yes gene_type:complete